MERNRKREKDREIKREREATAFRSPGALLSRSHSALHYLVTADASLGQTGTKSSPKSIVSTAEWLSIAGCIHLLRHLKKKKKKKKACAIVTKGERGGWCSLIFTLDRNDWVRDDVIKRPRRTLPTYTNMDHEPESIFHSFMVKCSFVIS